MNFYSQKIFPFLLKKNMSKPFLTEQRRKTLASAQGDILEIGFGTGLNLSAYPKNVEMITTIDIHAGMNPLAQKQMERSPIRVNHHVGSVENMPFADNSFDTVVSTWTLCSIEDVENALTEITRVLKQNGKLIFIEHGLSKNLKIKQWQTFLSPFWQKLSLGCHLERNIRELLEKNGFNIVEYEEFDVSRTLKIVGHTYRGIAVPDSKSDFITL